MEQPAEQRFAEEPTSAALPDVVLRVSTHLHETSLCFKLDLERKKAISMDCDEFQRIITAAPSVLSKYPQFMDLFFRNSDQWLKFSPENSGFPSELEQHNIIGTISDHENNRMLVICGLKGVYAFYPESSNWECLSGGRIIYDLSLSIALNNVLYGLFSLDEFSECGDKTRHKLVALDVADGCRPLKIVWPTEFNHEFFHESRYMGIVSLGDGKLCLLTTWHQCLDAPSDYDSDEYYYSSGEDQENECEEKEEEGEMKYMHVVSCMILEVEKEAPPPPQPNSRHLRRKTKLLVKTFTRLDFKLDDHVFSRDRRGFNFYFYVEKVLVVPR